MKQEVMQSSTILTMLMVLNIAIDFISYGGKTGREHLKAGYSGY